MYDHQYCQSRHVDVASLTLLSIPLSFSECYAILVEEPGQVLAGSREGLDVHAPFYPAYPTYTVEWLHIRRNCLPVHDIDTLLSKKVLGYYSRVGTRVVWLKNQVLILTSTSKKWQKHGIKTSVNLATCS